MGVRTPESNGDFVLGIECDGAAYHSARSARDRDRTRQLVLERIGWKIHRIWSTDWFKNHEKEISKVLEKIKFYSENGSSLNDNNYESSPGNYERIHVENEEEDYLENEYVEAFIPNHNNVRKVYRNKHNRGDLIEAIIDKVIEVEAPIHQDILFKKVADELGYGRVGSNIRYKLENYINGMVKRKTIKMKGDFLYANGKDIIVRDRGGLSNDLRNIDMIAPEEIQKAIIDTVNLTYGGDVESIVKEVGRVLGYSRVTENIFDSIREHVQVLIDESKLDLKDGRLNLA